jgi:uncharacterized membrane protein
VDRTTTFPELDCDDRRLDAPPSQPGPGPNHRATERGRLLELLVAAIALAGFGLRLYVAGGSYLNPDEALHYFLIHRPSLLLAYKASLTNAHPPLIYVVLYFWQFLGRSELMLRLPSVFAGTAFCWVLYKWIGMLFGRAAALATIILAALSPSLISLSAELRAYAIMLLCMTSALYFLERALLEKSVRQIWFFSACLWLAILSHYSVAFFALAAAVYALARIIQAKPGWRFTAAWVEGQVAALAIYALLYLTHLSKLRSGVMEVWAAPHEGAFFHSGQESLFAFTLRKSGAIFRFFFLEDYIYWGLLAAFAVAIAFLLVCPGWLRPKQRNREWPLALLLVIPFAAEWVAALARIYPYTGSRQSVFLAPFVFAGLGAVFEKLSGQRIWPSCAIATLIVLAAQMSPVRYEAYLSDANSAKTQMASAVQYVRDAVPRNGRILADVQSSFLLYYYLCDPAEHYVRVSVPAVDRLPCGGYSIISGGDTWKFTPENFVLRFRNSAAERGLQPDQTVWVFQAGWDANLNTELPWFVMKYRCLVSRDFGSSITVIPFVVGHDLSPELPPGSPHLSRMNRCVP